MSGDEHTLAGAYVLDALDDVEREAFEAYMAGSPDVQAEVESLREVAGLLGSAAVMTPPAGLRRAVLDRTDVIRQVPPVVTSIDAAQSARRAPRPATREWVTNLSRGAAAVASVVALALGVSVAQLSSRLDGVESANTRVATVVAAADAERVSVALDDGGRISAVISPEQGAAIVVGDRMQELSADRMYALWVIVDEVPVPIGELVDGSAVAVDVDGLQALAVTVEPRGPLSVPSTTPIGVLTA